MTERNSFPALEAWEGSATGNEEWGLTLSLAEVERMFPEHPYLSDSKTDALDSKLEPGKGLEVASPTPLSRKPSATEQSCPICLLGFSSSTPLRTTPCCHNDFHSSCLATWLSEARGVCPTCRYPFSARLEHGESANHEVAAGYEEVTRDLERQRAEAARRRAEEITIDVPAIEMEIRRPEPAVVKTEGADCGSAV